MKLEEQVCSLELAKKLKELGVKQEDALYAWIKCREKSKVPFNKQPFSWPETEDYVTTNSTKDWSWADWQCAAFTVAELGEMLPPNIPISRKGVVPHLVIGKLENSKFWYCDYHYYHPYPEQPAFEYFSKNQSEILANAMAESFIYLLEQGLITGDNINDRDR